VGCTTSASAARGDLVASAASIAPAAIVLGGTAREHLRD